jgi:hypothetical protein
MTLEQELIREFGTATFSERRVVGKGLGWSPKEDKRDWKLEDHIGSSLERTRGVQHWANPIQLNQGSEGACCGFAACGVCNAEPVIHEYGNDYGFKLYNIAKTLDPWLGEDYEGTTIRAAAQALQQEGHISNYAFTRNVETLAFFLLNYGPATIGVDWYGPGMDRVDSEGYIYPTGSIRGGHSVVIDGVVWNKGDEDNRFRIRNSWSSSWGLNGRCRIKAEDLQKLFDDGGSACCPIEIA